jgi:hypothetical protein
MGLAFSKVVNMPGREARKKVEAIVQDAEAYQGTRDIAACLDAAEGIRQGLQDAKNGRIRPAKEFFDEFEAEHGISR